jgi:hypothetical protein
LRVLFWWDIRTCITTDKPRWFLQGPGTLCFLREGESFQWFSVPACIVRNVQEFWAGSQDTQVPGPALWLTGYLSLSNHYFTPGLSFPIVPIMEQFLRYSDFYEKLMLTVVPASNVLELNGEEKNICMCVCVYICIYVLCIM